MRLARRISTAVATILAVFAIVTAIATSAIERGDPPAGRFVDVDGGRLHIVELGPADARPVVLLHGAAANLGDLRLALGERLAARYRVILVDRPGHGWSDRPDGRADSSPARQAALVHLALTRIGVTHEIVLGHSWSGALATAFALAYPADVAGLVLVAPLTHPWPGTVVWINELVAMPVIGPLIAHTLIMPLGYFLLAPGVNFVFAPQTPPPDYIERAGIKMLLRPSEFIANAQDLVDIKTYLTAQAPHYGDIKVPVAIVAGNVDPIVSTDSHSRRIAALLPHATLTVLPGVGHMVTYAAPDRVVQAVDEIAAASAW